MTGPLLVAYKVLTPQQRETLRAERIFCGAPIDLADGYIHLSTGNQLAETLNKHFTGQTDLYIAAVDLEKLGDAVKWEESRGGQLFPHVYGPLPLSAITAMFPLERDSTGALSLPLGI